MTKDDFDQLKGTMDELRKAVRRNNPLIRGLVSSRVFPLASLISAAPVLFFCLGTHVLMHEGSGFESLPFAWRLGFWIFLVLFLVAGGVLKTVYIDRRAQKLDSNASFATVVKALFGGSWFHLNIPALIICAVAIAFACWVGHPWFALPAATLSLVASWNTFGAIAHRAEFFAAGWFSLLAGALSLFFVESAPFLWLAIVLGGMLTVYGIVGLAQSAKEAAG